jgi:hypothetical protein
VEVPDRLVFGREFVGDFGGPVVAAVFGDDHLVAPRGEKRVEVFERHAHRLGQCRLLVVGGQDDAHLDGRSHCVQVICCE